MTLKQLASKAGCTDAYLSQLERDHANPSIMVLKGIAEALQVKVVDFFLEQETGENDVVLKEKERVNINFKQGDAKDPDACSKHSRIDGCSPSIRRSSQEEDQKDLTLISERNVELC